MAFQTIFLYYITLLIIFKHKINFFRVIVGLLIV